MGVEYRTNPALACIAHCRTFQVWAARNNTDNAAVVTPDTLFRRDEIDVGNYANTGIKDVYYQIVTATHAARAAKFAMGVLESGGTRVVRNTSRSLAGL